MDSIKIRGAREHNLKNIDIDIPKNKFVVITGVSGSGKSSLAFETIYSEGQRRYIESLSAYARQFISQMGKPELDSIEGLSPAISIEQKTVSKNPRSTVGTITEIYDYLRLLFGHIGVSHCPKCGEIVKKESVDEIIDDVFKITKKGDKVIFLSPVVIDKKGTHKNLFSNLLSRGYIKVRVDNVIYDLDEEIDIDKNKRHNIEVVIDRIIIKGSSDEKTRITKAIEDSFLVSNGKMTININDADKKYSENYICKNHPEIEFLEIQPRLFSFNAPYGACDECNGLGSNLKIDVDKLILNRNLSINDGGMYIGVDIKSKNSYTYTLFETMAKKHNIDLNKPVKDLTDKEMNIILYGSDEVFKFVYHGKELDYEGYKTYEGLVNTFERRYKEMSDSRKEEIENKYMTETKCSKCNGKRLKDTVLSIKVNNLSIHDVCDMSIKDCFNFFNNLKLNEKQEKIAKEILKEIKDRLSFLINVGLDYLTLTRMSKTLSGGEAQRIRLASQIGSKLTGVIYVLDEPSIGLHQRDNDKLLSTLKELRDLGNSLIVVEHDEDTMLNSDYIIDIGPRAGVFGGEVVLTGEPKKFLKGDSLTSKYLNKKLKIEIPKERRKPKGFIEVENCSGNNLKNIDLKIPKGVLTVVTGVSGSGKSSLINQTFYPAIYKEVYGTNLYGLKYDKVKGLEDIRKIIAIDQSPIGRTPRSNTATYTSIFDDVRKLFAESIDSKTRGYSAGRFSFNVKGGRCEACQGAGINKIEMNFLPDVYVECEVCKGKRYNSETLEVKYKDKNINDVLNMSVLEAYKFFDKIPSINRKLETLVEVGMDYITLGQPATTLSGGEAQRIKLASELYKRSNSDTVYILDEPTTGLHFDDVNKLTKLLHKLVDMGNTVVVIEHNLDVIKSADYIIDIGPEGGEKGGEIIAIGTPEEVSKNKKSYTAKYLKKILDADKKGSK